MLLPMLTRYFSLGLVFFTLLFYHQSKAQQTTSNDSIPVNEPSQKPLFIGKKKYKQDTVSKKDYVVINYKRDTAMVDTTLSISKEYRHNFTRRDLFGYVPLLNPGQVANRLTLFEHSPSLVPEMGFKARHLDYYEVEDIKYFRVPTAFSEIYYKTGFEQGQSFEALFTANTDPNLNFSLAYKGIRSLGLYRNSLSTQGNFRGTLSFQSKNKRYDARVHIAIQDSGNQENGGLTEKAMDLFTKDDKEFHSRGRLDTNLGEKTESLLEGSRYYLDHRYHLVTRSNFKGIINHQFGYEGKNYRFTEEKKKDFFGNGFNNRTFDITAYKSFKNTLSIDFKSRYLLGKFRVKGYHQSIYQGYRNVNFFNQKQEPYQKNIENYGLGVNWYAHWHKIDLEAYGENLFLGEITGARIGGKVRYFMNRNWLLEGQISITDKSPNISMLFFQSNYKAYNWNNTHFSNQQDKTLQFALKSKWGTLGIIAKQLNNYTYFKKVIQTGEGGKKWYQIKALQAQEAIPYFKISLQNEVNFWKFSWNNRGVFQQVENAEGILHLPQWFIRSSIYFSETLFKKKSLFLQTGITFNYFSNYYGDDYNPVIGDFATQQETMIGGYPYLEVFVNTMVRQTRFFLKIDNVTAPLLGKKNYLATPNMPRQDFEIRFGLVWNFFK